MHNPAAAIVHNHQSVRTSCFSGVLALRGTFVHAPVFGLLEILEDYICVASARKDGGKIIALVPARDSASLLTRFSLELDTVYRPPVSYSHVCIEMDRNLLISWARKRHSEWSSLFGFAGWALHVSWICGCALSCSSGIHQMHSSALITAA